MVNGGPGVQGLPACPSQTPFLKEGDGNGPWFNLLGEHRGEAQVQLHSRPHYTLLGAEAGPCLF